MFPDMDYRIADFQVVNVIIRKEHSCYVILYTYHKMLSLISTERSSSA